MKASRAKSCPKMGMTRIYGEARNNNGVVLKGSNAGLIGFMGVILFIITAFVMFSLAFILIFRFVTLLFLIIVAPIGFAGLAIPKMSNLANKWWGQLFEQSMIAPVLLLLLYVALSVITSTSFLSGVGGKGADWTGFVDNANLPGFASLILSFLIAMGLLLGVVIAAKRMGAVGAGWAMKAGGALSFGAASFGLRGTLAWQAMHSQASGCKAGLERTERAVLLLKDWLWQVGVFRIGPLIFGMLQVPLLD